MPELTREQVETMRDWCILIDRHGTPLRVENHESALQALCRLALTALTPRPAPEMGVEPVMIRALRSVPAANLKRMSDHDRNDILQHIDALTTQLAAAKGREHQGWEASEFWKQELANAETKLAAANAEIERLRAECGVRQIAGYQKGKAESESRAAAAEGALATQRKNWFVLVDAHRGWCNYCKGNEELCLAAPKDGCVIAEATRPALRHPAPGEGKG